MNILDIAVVLRGTRHEVWLPTLSDQKSHFWSVFRNNKSFTPDMRTVIWDKVKKKSTLPITLPQQLSIAEA